MPELQITTIIEYECSRCAWKWIARKNGKDKPRPSFCPHCKTWMWDIKRKNDMGEFWNKQKMIHAHEKGMIWDEARYKWKTPINKSEKELLRKILDIPYKP